MKKLDHKAIGLFFLQYLFKTGVFAIVFCAVIFFIITANFSTASGVSADLISSSYAMPLTVSLIVFFLYIGALYTWALLFYNSYSYEMTADSFKQEFGVISKEFISIPYDNIQDVEVIQDIFLRLLGLGRMDIKTAGEGEEEEAAAVLVAVAINDAKTLKDELMKKVDEHR
ncbi:MAG TPA: PH domain-containing protein [Patescibacteria group bacterium]|nr:PH domain-containing protein [Patescibacteria group bacterium]